MGFQQRTIFHKSRKKNIVLKLERVLIWRHLKLRTKDGDKEGGKRARNGENVGRK